MTQIFYSYISNEKHDRLLKNYLPEFPVDFQHRIMRYRRWQDAQLSLLGRLLLKHGFAAFNMQYEEEALEYTKYEKPFLKDQNIKFNISHSGELVVCVITDVCDIGIDVEIFHKVRVPEFKSQMTAIEWERIDTAEDKLIAFFTYWTQKEAVIKAHGKGLSLPLKSFEVTNNYTLIKEAGFRLKEIFLDELYKCHLAYVEGSEMKLVEPRKIEF